MSDVKRVIIYDEHEQPWTIYEDDAIFDEALAATQEKPDEKVTWPISKLTSNRGFGWWTIFKQIDDLEIDLTRQFQNPSQILIRTDKEYTPQELRDLIQRFGSCLASITHIEGLIEAQTHALKESYKSGMAVAITREESKATTLTGKEAEILSKNELFKTTRRLQIANESSLLLIQSWRKAYESAYNTASRLITLMLGELEASRLT